MRLLLCLAELWQTDSFSTYKKNVEHRTKGILGSLSNRVLVSCIA